MRSPTAKEDKITQEIGFNAVYLLVPSHDRENGPCKVGQAASPRSRLSAHQTSNWVEVEFADLFYCRLYYANHLESTLHAHYDSMDLRIRGEWFDGGAQFLAEEARTLFKEQFADEKVYSFKSMLRIAKASQVELALRQDKARKEEQARMARPTKSMSDIIRQPRIPKKHRMPRGTFA